MNKKFSLSGAVCLMALAGFGFGCNPFQSAQDKISEKVSEKFAEGVLGEAAGGKVDIDTNSNTVNFKDNKTGSEMAYGDDVRIPGDFPKEIKIYPGSKANSVVLSRKDDQASSVTLVTSDSVADVAAWYDKQMAEASWKSGQSMSFNGVENRSYDKDKAHIALTVSSDTDEKKETYIFLSYSVGTVAKTDDNASDKGGEEPVE